MSVRISRKYVAEQGILMSKLSKIISNFSVALLHFSYRRTTKKYKFSVFLPLKKTLVINFNETCLPTSRKYVPEQGTVMPNLSKTFQNF